MQPPKYPSTPHWPWSQKVHRDDSYHENPEFFVNRPVIITEKIDGGNTLLYNGQVYARSTVAPSNDGWFAMVKKHHAWKSNYWDDSTFVYGEDMYGIHSIEYDPVFEPDTYYVFAVRRGDYFLSWSDVVSFSVENGLGVVPTVYFGTFGDVEEISEFLVTNLATPSALGGEKEGFVIRLAQSFPVSRFQEFVCKYVRKDHVQTDEHWRENWQPCPIKR